MKMRKLTLCLLAFALAVCLCVPAFAAGSSQAQLGYVTDLYGLLDPGEAEVLERNAAQLSSRYNCGIYVLVVKDYRDYSDDTFRFAMDVFEQYNLGLTGEKTGVLLMLSMADRDYELLFHGDSTDRIFTDYGRDLLEDAFLPSFRDNDFYTGFAQFQNKCGELLQADAEGHPVDRTKHFSLLTLLPGLFAAGITGGAMSSGMKSVGTKRNANAYIVSGSVTMHQQSDLFLHRTVSRRPRESSSSGGSSHGSSHSSGSYSGRSGKF